MKHLMAVMVASLAMTNTVDAKVRLPHLVGDNMVVQQQSAVRLWGWAKPGAVVKVSPSWSKTTVKVKTDNSGRWHVRVSTPQASMTPHSITFDDGESLTINNVLIGEVWVCAGQSNMEMPVKGFENCPVDDYNHVVADAVGSSAIRSVKVPSVMSTRPLDDFQGEWRVGSPQTVGDFSATGYFFARMVSRTLQIPIGLIEANKGGSRVESWLDESNLRRHTKEDLDSATMHQRFRWDFHYPLLWANGTFHPILNYTVKGIIYYQGCSNVGDPGNQYSERLKLLVEQWRRDFALGELPFYFVQIDTYHYGDNQGTGGALLREQQYRASTIIPNCAVVPTVDAVYLYESQQIHPAQKQKVGERLAYSALKKTYGCQQFICDAPTYRNMEVKGDTVYVRLNHLEGGINRLEGLEGFEIAGSDRVFHPVTGTYNWRHGVMLVSPEVKHPVAVRYCFRNFALGNVANQGGLPLIPFRSDDW